MALKGLVIGGVVGAFAGGLAGSLVGAVIGSVVEDKLRKVNGIPDEPQPKRRAPRETFEQPDSPDATADGYVFCACAAALLAKLAKADGVVTQGEIAAVEGAFQRLGFSRGRREFAINVFRRAKGDSRTIFEYAYDFVCAVPSVEVRELLYELLWDVSCADGVVAPEVVAILRQLPPALGIRPAWFEYYARERLGGSGSARPGGASGIALADAYELLGASASDDAGVLKKKYRELAKKFHPDALRAQGLPDAMIGKANEHMSRINAAWTAVKAARGL